MKCLAIGDLFVTADAMAEGLVPLRDKGVELEFATFDVGGYDQLQETNHRIEQSGPESFELDSDLRSKMLNAEILVVHFCPVSGSLARQSERLRLVGTCRTGTSNIDAAVLDELDIPLLNCAGRLADAVADFTVGMMICEARNIARGHAALKRNIWMREYSNLGQIPDLPGRTAGLIGFGAIGQAVARRLRGFDMNILVCDPFVDADVAKDAGAELVEMDQLMRVSDFVSVHVDLSEKTRNLIDAEQIGLMKPTAYFINTARGGVVNEAALIDALSKSRIAGAALDVFDEEPPPADHPYMTLENVTITPHMAGGSDDAFRRSPSLLCKRILKNLPSA